MFPGVDDVGPVRTDVPQQSVPRRWSAPSTLGPATIAALAVGQFVLWLVMWPSGQSTGSYIGQLLGAEAVLLMSIGLVLISSLSLVEPWFNGIDHAAVWHRRVTITAMVLLLGHVALAANPDPSTVGPVLGAVGMFGLVVLAVWAILPRWRSVAPRPIRRWAVSAGKGRLGRLIATVFGGYARWRVMHRLTGLFVAAGFVHGLLDSTAFDSAVLRWSYVAVGGIGLAFYVYRELLSRHVLPQHDYQVDRVTPVGPGLVEIVLRPLGRPIVFAPGQFALIYIEGKDGWHRHPFTISSAPHDDAVRITVKALGDFTSNIEALVEPGMPAVIGRAHGRFDHRRGTDRQVWIAGGVGITPFLSWLRSADSVELPARADFFYSVDGPAPFGDEIRAIAARHDSLRVHIIDTTVAGRLTPEVVLATVGGDPEGLSVFMCGPRADAVARSRPDWAKPVFAAATSTASTSTHAETGRTIAAHQAEGPARSSTTGAGPFTRRTPGVWGPDRSRRRA